MSSDRLPRREFLQATSIALTGVSVRNAAAQPQNSLSVEVLNPRDRVPLSFIIDDSTCLVNMGHFAMPQFAQAWPNRQEYKQPWQQWPREIPDAFVRKFGEWCGEHGVKGKYSIVPYPACVGWMDRDLPGWSHRQLQSSLQLVRDLMVPNWDIHPEMITHTRVIDLKTGRPMAEANPATMENSFPQSEKSVDELASYMAYALRVLKNCGLPCEGITTPGGFGNRVKPKLPIAVHQAVRDVFGSPLPHYFKYVVDDHTSTVPRLEFLDDQKTVDNLTVNVPAGTGDWFGGWEGARTSQGFRYSNEDATSGRLVDLIQRGLPAVMLCHWPGMYCNGAETGFEDFKKVVVAIANRFANQTVWMKVSEIGRYYAAKQLATATRRSEYKIDIESPLSCPQFTFRLNRWFKNSPPVLSQHSNQIALQDVSSISKLKNNTYAIGRDDSITICIDAIAGNQHVTTSAS